MANRRGFLTAKDRAFLQGETAYESKQGRYERRRSIRERTQDAFRDFRLLSQTLEPEEREKIFAPLADGVYHPHAVPGRGGEPPESYHEADSLKAGLQSMFGFVYLGLWGTPVPFDELLGAAVYQTERDEHGRHVDVSLSIDEQEPLNAIESAITKLEVGSTDDLSSTETQLLLAFLMAPAEYGPSSARDDALERLNDLDPFAVSADDPSPD